MDLKEEFDKEWQKKSKKHAALTIKNEVKDWTGPKAPTAERRWMWELLQNAIDTAKDNEISNLPSR